MKVKITSRGFSLIELMIVVAIIGVLASVALPAYQDYAIRGRVSEAVIAGAAAKNILSEGYSTDRTTGLNAAAGAVNLIPVAEKQSKYVSNICVGAPGAAGVPCAPFANDGRWTIFVTISSTPTNGIPITLNGLTFALSPNVLGRAPVPTSTETLDWACTSASSQTAVGRGMTNFSLGTMPAKYMPAECR